MSTLILPFSLWSMSSQDVLQAQPLLQSMQAPLAQHWFEHAQRKAVQWQAPPCGLYRTGLRLNTPQEWALAQAQAWPLSQLQDGLLPWAAQAAKLQGLTAPDDEAWAWVSWCHWNVSNGRVVLIPPEHLQLDDAQDQALFDVMQPFFAEDGITLYRHQPGQWLAHAAHFVNLPTASLARMLSRNIEGWMVGGEHPDATAQRVRRLQNEVQMLLYTHPLNDSRALAINSFWLHGTGSLPASTNTAAVHVWDDLQDSALAQDFSQWVLAWQQIQHRWTQLQDPPQRVVLCGEDQLHVYEPTKDAPWRRAVQTALTRLRLQPRFSWATTLLHVQHDH